jgi:hypothetical protein
MNKLKRQYELIACSYVKSFCNKHEIPMSDYEILQSWIGPIGNIICISDMYLNYADIRYDIDNDIENDKIIDWYWKNLEHAELGIKYIAFEEYCKGKPDPVEPEHYNNIKILRKKLDDAHREFLEAIESYKDGEPLFI